MPGGETALEQEIRTRLGAELGALDVPDAAERRRVLLDLLRSWLDGEGGEELAALTARAGSAGDSVRAVYQLRLSRVVAMVMPAMPGEQEERARRAWAVVATVVGAVSVSRALADSVHRGAVREAALRSVEALVAGE
ncbi:hypothetical protein [Lentzea sp.]|uniref:hypothetical protein n=1 Tax=Lentzea sp. TaxID=56099 RepID=UPI002ED63531